MNLERKFTLPSGREVSGMGIPEGITLIAGGGFHVGKSSEKIRFALIQWR